MKNRYLYRILIIATIFSLIVHACNAELEIEVPAPDALIVIDGWIDKGDQAKVFLTTNAPYFTTIDSSSLRDLVLSRAKVTLSDGENSEVLILRRDERYFPPYYYAGNDIFGDTGKTYTLLAEYGGKSAHAATSIPPGVDIESTSFHLAEDQDSLGYLRVTFSDPGSQKNYYRIFTKRKSKDKRFISSFIIALNDQYFNGEEISFTIYRPPDSFLSSEESDLFSVGDTIIVKLTTMTKPVYDFWSDYQDEVISATNPFASSMYEINSNIEGDGLGIWAGYNNSIDTVIAVLPKK